jgi:hypothetical protein
MVEIDRVYSMLLISKPKLMPYQPKNSENNKKGIIRAALVLIGLRRLALPKNFKKLSPIVENC